MAACPYLRVRGTSELHRARVPGNTRAGRPDGKCHRNIPPLAERGCKAPENPRFVGVA